MKITGVSTTEGGDWEKQRGFLKDHFDDLAGGKRKHGLLDIISDEVYDIKLELGRRVSSSNFDF